MLIRVTRPARAGLFICLAVSQLILQQSPARAEGGRVLELKYHERFEPHETKEIVGELFGDRPVPEARYIVDAYIVRYTSYYPHSAGERTAGDGTQVSRGPHDRSAVRPPWSPGLGRLNVRFPWRSGLRLLGECAHLGFAQPGDLCDLNRRETARE